MQANKEMRLLLQECGVDNIDEIPPNTSYPIWEKKDGSGRSYFGVGNFCGIDQDSVPIDQDLSDFEWDGNELYFSTQSFKGVPALLKKVIGILKGWKAELEMRFPNIQFYVFASYDNGDFCEFYDGDEPPRSMYLRFWAERGTKLPLLVPSVEECVEQWGQPVIMDVCNPK